VISGATSELGSVLAYDFAAQNANLALLSRDPTRLEVLVKDLAVPEG
jgi:short-subunit dehydrogenase